MGSNVAGRRVALVASAYHPDVGGVEEHVRHTARVLRERGHEVEVWTVARDGRSSVDAVAGVRVRRLPAPLPTATARGVATFLLRVPRAAAAWWRARRSFRPDVLHVQCFGPNGVYGTALAAIARRPLVLSAHGETFMDDQQIFDRSAVLDRALRLALRRADVVTGCSRTVLADLQRRYSFADGVVVPNGVADPWATTTAPLEPPFLVAAGRLVHVKGFDLLLQAFALHPDDRLRLAVIGDGPERPTLVQLARRLGVESRVDFVGRLTNDEVRGWMAAATAVVVPSRVEAFGIVVLEAWNAGTPVVVTSHGGPADLVTNGRDGLVVDPSDIDELTSAIGRLVEHDALRDRLGDAGRASARSFTWDAVGDHYESLYRTLSAG